MSHLTASNQALLDLKNFVIRMLPSLDGTHQLTADPKRDAVILQCHGRLFLIRKTLEVFEMRNQDQLQSGPARLLQELLMQKSGDELVLQAVLDVIGEAEQCIQQQRDPAASIELLCLTEWSLSQLTARPPRLANPALLPLAAIPSSPSPGANLKSRL
jgi:hypothetical protein